MVTGGGRGLRPFRLLPSESGTDDFTFEAPAPATFATIAREPGAQALILYLDCAEGAPPIKRTIVLVRLGRVWRPKAGFRLALLGTYEDPASGQPGAVYEAIADASENPALS